MNRSRIVVGLTALALSFALCADAVAQKSIKLNKRELALVDARDRALAEAKNSFDAGLQYTQSRLYDQAISRFESAIAKFKEADQKDRELVKSNKKVTRMKMPQEHALAMMNMGACNLQKGKPYHSRGRQQLEDAARLEAGAENPLVWYNLTAARTLTGSMLEAIDALDNALTFGFKNFDALRSDEDLYELRRMPEWRKTLEKHGVFL